VQAIGSLCDAGEAAATPATVTCGPWHGQEGPRLCGRPCRSGVRRAGAGGSGVGVGSGVVRGRQFRGRESVAGVRSARRGS